MRQALWLGMLLLAGCSLSEMGKRASDHIGTGRVLALAGLEGRWAGPVHPTDPACGPERHGLMRIGDASFAFDPFESTTVINGTVRDGALNGTLSRPGGGGRTVSIRFEGRAEQEETITGTLTSGPCTWQVTLRRA